MFCTQSPWHFPRSSSPSDVCNSQCTTADSYHLTGLASWINLNCFYQFQSPSSLKGVKSMTHVRIMIVCELKCLTPNSVLSPSAPFWKLFSHDGPANWPGRQKSGPKFNITEGYIAIAHNACDISGIMEAIWRRGGQAWLHTTGPHTLQW